jgi:hypothetical protein
MCYIARLFLYCCGPYPEVSGQAGLEPIPSTRALDKANLFLFCIS